MNIIFIWTAVFVSHYASWVWNISSIIWSLEKISYSLETFCFSNTNFFDKRHNFPALTAELVYGIKMSLRCFSLKIARTDDYSRGILWPSLACCPNTPTRSCFKANKTQLHMLSFSVTALVMDSYLLAVFSRIKWPATTTLSWSKPKWGHAGGVFESSSRNKLHPRSSYTEGIRELQCADNRWQRCSVSLIYQRVEVTFETNQGEMLHVERTARMERSTEPILLLFL